MKITKLLVINNICLFNNHLKILKKQKIRIKLAKIFISLSYFI